MRVKLITRTYITCTESEFSPVHPIVTKKIEAAGTEWDFVKWQTSHMPMAFMPEKFNGCCLKSPRMAVEKALGAITAYLGSGKS